MQKNVLEAYPSLDIKAYAVWFNMVFLDDRSRCPGDALPDHRVTHYWDEEKLVGRWYSNRFGRPGQTAWDLYFLYAAGADSLASQDSILAWGAPVISRGPDLRKAVAALAEARAGR